MLGDLNCTMDKIDRDGENKTQRLYRCCSNYALSKLIVDNGLEDLWRRENPDSPEFTCYDRSFGQNPGQTGSVLIYKLITIPRLIKSWYPLLIIIILFLMTDSPQRLKQKKKIHGALIILFYVSPSSPKLQRLFFFFIRNTKHNHSSAGNWWEYTKSFFKENTNIFHQFYHPVGFPLITQKQ